MDPKMDREPTRAKLARLRRQLRAGNYRPTAQAIAKAVVARLEIDLEPAVPAGTADQAWING